MTIRYTLIMDAAAVDNIEWLRITYGLKIDPHKRADPLGWPFNPKVRERAKQQPEPVYPPAPF